MISEQTDSLIQYFHTPSEEFLNSSIYITWAGHRYCDAEHMIGPRVLDTYKLLFVINGKGYLKQGDNPLITISQGDIVILFPKERHHYYADPEDPWELMWVSFNGSICPTLLKEVGLSHDNYILTNALTHSIQRTLQTLINSLGDTDDVDRLCATGQLYILFAYLRQMSEKKKRRPEITNANQDPCVWKAIRFIEQNFYLDINVDMLCKHVNYSRSYLSRIFKTELNMSIPEYTNMVRIQNAKSLLTETNMPMHEIATSIGIHDSFYFSKLFKKITGETPREYRKSHQIKV